MAMNNDALIAIVDEFVDLSESDFEDEFFDSSESDSETEFFDSSESDSESDAEIDDELLLNANRAIRVKRPRLQNYFDIIALYDDQEFKSNFRLRRDTYDYILNIIRPNLEKRPQSFGRYPISASKQLYIALWMLATPDPYRSVCAKFDIGKATARRSLLRVVKALYKLRNKFISWPTREQAEETWTKIEHRNQFPGVIGAVDATLVKITPPKMHPEEYICRKNYHAVQLQVVCDADLRFIHCYAGLPGSIDDMRTFSHSGLQLKFNEHFFPGDSHLLGDAAYMIQRHVMVPYRDNGYLTAAETRFNKKLSSARMTVERSIGLLKGRWCCLLDKLPVTGLELISICITACCVLHNICLLRRDEIEIPILIDPQNNIVEELRPVTHSMLGINDEDHNGGLLKRENLTRAFRE